MRGGVGSEIKKLRDDLVKFASLIELELDFSEEDVEFASRKKFISLLNNVDEFMSRLIDSFKYGNSLKEGIPVSIVGAPNVGKSTLLNSILNEDKAITSPIPGTTRDIIEDKFNLKGTLFRFIDTAGIRKTDDDIEKIGISRTLESIKKSEIILFLVDSTSQKKIIDNQIKEANKLKKKYNQKKIIIIFTKIDLKNNLNDSFKSNSISINTKEQKDILEIKKIILENLSTEYTNQVTITNTRHYSALSHARKEINEVQKGIKNGIPSDLLSVDLKQAIYHLGEITGEVTNDEILSNIFSKFCIGK
jgi:tRNA modification GTPase